jgi:hypothetical protein
MEGGGMTSDLEDWVEQFADLVKGAPEPVEMVRLINLVWKQMDVPFHLIDRNTGEEP